MHAYMSVCVCVCVCLSLCMYVCVWYVQRSVSWVFRVKRMFGSCCWLQNRRKFVSPQLRIGEVLATDCDVEWWEIGANVAMGIGRKISKVILAKYYIVKYIMRFSCHIDSIVNDMCIALYFLSCDWKVSHSILISSQTKQRCPSLSNGATEHKGEWRALAYSILQSPLAGIVVVVAVESLQLAPIDCRATSATGRGRPGASQAFGCWLHSNNENNNEQQHQQDVASKCNKFSSHFNFRCVARLQLSSCKYIHIYRATHTHTRIFPDSLYFPRLTAYLL